MHAEFDGLDHVGEGFLSAGFGQDSGQKLLAAATLELYFDERIALLEFTDQRIRFAQIHRRVIDNLAFTLRRVDYRVRRGGQGG
jgi:hypothetical protein